VTGIDRWREALLLPGATDAVASGVRELAEYFGITEAEARRRCEMAVDGSKREWESAPRDTPERIRAFYRETQSYLYEHVWWHSTCAESNAGNVAILDYALRRGVRRYLDFGSGVGANALLFARAGLSVTLADVSCTMLDFARWRMERRGLAATYIDLTEKSLPEAGFDMVTAVDVIEHLAEPEAEAKRLSRTLERGGVLIFNDATGPDADRPMHILRTPYPVLKGLMREGCRAAGREADELRRLGYYVMGRSVGPVGSVTGGLYGLLRYGSAARMARAAWVALRRRGLIG
jgi:2-polyprenyl-3-methyl-5-hydroxy-6-metoxy-1,4-benzoquinol methylase